MSIAVSIGFVQVDSREPASQEEEDNLSYREALSPAISSIANEDEERRRDSIDKLLALLNLGDNWDGEDSPAPSPELIYSAIDLIKLFYRNLPELARAVPINDGRIALDFYVGDVYLNARIDAPGKASVMVTRPGQPAEFIPWQWGSATGQLGWFSS